MIYIILISILLIYRYYIVGLVFSIFWALLELGIRFKYFARMEDWPTFSPISVFSIAIISGLYMLIMVMENINNYIKYIIFIIFFITYIFSYIKYMKNKKN